MDYETILYEEDAPIGTNTLNRPDDQLREETRKWALHIAKRGPLALAAIKHAFCVRSNGVNGLGRMAHDLFLQLHLDTEESADLSKAFGGRRDPDEDKFGR